MRNFYRALREAWCHWPTLAAAIVCSLAVAVLWSANIFALLPIIETTINGENLHNWNKKRIASIQAKVDRLTTEREAIVLPAQADRDYAKVKLKKELVETNLLTEQVKLRFSEQLQPWLERWFPTNPFYTVAMVLALVVFGTVLKQIFSLTNVVLVNYVSHSIAREIRMRIFGKAVTMDRDNFNFMGGVSGYMSYITQTTDCLAQGITAFYGGLVAEPMRILCCLIAAFMVSWRVTLASLIFAPVMAGLMIWLNRRIRSLAKDTMDRSLGFHHVILEVFSALNTVQANTMEQYELERFRESTKQMRRMYVLASFYSALASPITEIFGITALCTGLAAASYLVITQETTILGISMAGHPMTVPELGTVAGLLVGATDPLRKLSGVFSSINSGSAAANFIYPLLDSETQITSPSQPKTIPTPHRMIEFRDVAFAYDKIWHVIKHVDLKIPFGERLAIIGPNGGGKSTLMNLLCRFYDPQLGEILIDDVPIKDLAISDLRQRIAIVSQQSDFFNETIFHNIRYGRWDASDEEVMEAAKKAKAHEFITGFSDGYQTLVGPNGQRLSGGQRQRIALARAILRNAEIVILDEATSQIDMESEKLIHDALLEYSRDRTLIMITHRESTLELATRVVQVDRARVTEVTRDALKAA